MSDILQVQGINEKGFGIIPKLIMQDKRLTAEAKAIYGYFCSYAGAGRTAFPSRDKIVSDLGISVKRYYRHFDLLKQYGYIKIEREKPVNGKLQRNIYTLMDIVPCSQNYHKEKPCSQNAYEQNAYEQNDYTNNNSIKNNNLNINNPVKSSLSEKPDGQDEGKTDDTAQQIEAYYSLIKENIDYDSLAVSMPYDMKLVDEFIAIIVDTAMTEGKTVRIGGEDKPRALVVGQLMKLAYSDIELVIDQFKNVTDRISKKKQYILTMLYNAKLEGDSHYTNLVNHDRWNGGGC